MPVLQVEMVVAEDEMIPDSMAEALAVAAADVLDRPPGRTWVRLRALPANRYAEDAGVPPGVMPVFVEVLMRELPPLPDRREFMSRLTRALAQACNRPVEHVHLDLSAAAGRAAFGGELIA